MNWLEEVPAALMYFTTEELMLYLDDYAEGKLKQYGDGPVNPRCNCALRSMGAGDYSKVRDRMAMELNIIEPTIAVEKFFEGWDNGEIITEERPRVLAECIRRELRRRASDK